MLARKKIADFGREPMGLKPHPPGPEEDNEPLKRKSVSSDKKKA
jgi:hypothetical protein